MSRCTAPACWRARRSRVRSLDGLHSQRAFHRPVLRAFRRPDRILHAVGGSGCRRPDAVRPVSGAEGCRRRASACSRDSGSRRSMWIRTAYSVTAGARLVARGRVCVLACGASYALQRKLGLGMPRLLLHSAQVELPAERLGDVEVHFGRSVAPRGFAWAVPVQRERPVRAHRRDVRPRRRPPFPRHRRQACRPLGDHARRTFGSRGRKSCRSDRSRGPTATACWRSATPPGS